MRDDGPISAGNLKSKKFSQGSTRQKEIKFGPIMGSFAPGDKIIRLKGD